MGSKLRGRLDHTVMKRVRECCQIEFTSSIAYAQHCAAKHREWPEFTCSVCGKVCRGRGPLERHQQGHARRVRVFWSKVDKNGPNGCWVWTRSKRKGYGRVSNGKGRDAAQSEAPCKLCDFVANKPSGLRSHMRFKHPEAR